MRSSCIEQAYAPMVVHCHWALVSSHLFSSQLGRYRFWHELYFLMSSTFMNLTAHCLNSFILVGGFMHSEQPYLQVVNHIMKYAFKVQISYFNSSCYEYIDVGFQRFSLFMSYVEQGKQGDIMLVTLLEVRSKR